MPARPQHNAAGISQAVTPAAPDRPARTTTSPNAAMDAPHPMTDQTTALPCRRMLPSGPENRPARKAPTAVEASSMPTVVSPPPIMRAPTAGSSARGWARIMATRSMMNVMRRLGRVPRNRKPSTTDRSPARACLLAGRHGRKLQQSPEGERETHQVQRVSPAESDRGHEHPGQQRACGHGQPERDHAESVRCREEFLPDQDGNDGAAGRLVDGLRAALHGHQGVEQPHVSHLQPGLESQPANGRPHHRGREQCHPAAVVRVGDRSAQQPSHHQRNQRKDAEQPHVEAVLRQPVDLQADGHQRQLAADVGYGRACPEPAEGRAFAQRSDVCQ